jgi:pyruvate formate lyase activating enzyme
MIERDWHQINHYRLNPSGQCSCGSRIAGHFATQAGQFGRRRIPIRMA